MRHHVPPLLLQKPKTVGKYDQIQCKHPKSIPPLNYLRAPFLSTSNWRCHEITYPPRINLQATKLFIVTSATKGGGNPLRFRVRFKILYRVIQPLIQHCLLHKMVYLNIIYYVTATRNYEFFTTGIFP